MSDRYQVRSAIATETGSVRDGIREYTPAQRGFQIYDTFEDKREDDLFTTRGEAQEECDRRNGRL